MDRGDAAGPARARPRAADGSLVDEGGRVEIRYKPNDGAPTAPARATSSWSPGASRSAGRHLRARPPRPPSEGAARSAVKPRRARHPGRARGMAFTDGACSGNPGPAGSGVVLVAPGGKMHEGLEYLGEATNNVAELTAILRALEWIPADAGAIVVHTDSQYAIGVLPEGLEGEGQPGARRADAKRVVQERGARLVLRARATRACRSTSAPTSSRARPSRSAAHACRARAALTAQCARRSPRTHARASAQSPALVQPVAGGRSPGRGRRRRRRPLRATAKRAAIGALVAGEGAVGRLRPGRASCRGSSAIACQARWPRARPWSCPGRTGVARRTRPRRRRCEQHAAVAAPAGAERRRPPWGPSTPRTRCAAPSSPSESSSTDFQPAPERREGRRRHRHRRLVREPLVDVEDLLAGGRRVVPRAVDRRPSRPAAGARARRACRRCTAPPATCA